ncbi:MAG: PAS domain S-box protein [Candidatus Peregrinibacteria bacterium]
MPKPKPPQDSPGALPINPSGENNEKYKLLFEKLDEGIFLMESEGPNAGHIVEVNETAARMTGYSVAELLTMKVTDLDVLENVEKAPERFAEILEGKWIGAQIMHVRKDGTLFPVEFQAGPITINDKRYTLAFVRDITHHVQTELEATESKNFLENILENIGDPIFVKDEARRWIVINDAFCTFMGRPREELIGKSDYEFFPKEQADVFWEKDAIVFENGKMNINEEAFTDAKGAVHTIVTKKNIFADSRGKRMLVGIIRDITEHKKLEESLKLQDEILKNVTEGIYLVRMSDGNIVYTNPKFEQLFGYAPDEMLGKHASIVNAPTEKKPEETAAEIMKILAETGEWHGEIQNIKKDGTTFWCSANVSAFDHHQHGKVIVAAHTDITEDKRSKERLKIIEQEQSTILNSVPALIFYKDTENRFLRVNKTFCEIMHMTNGALEGKSLFDLYPKDQAEKFWQDDKEIFASGKSKMGIIESMLSPRGTRWMQTDKIPYRDSQGKIIGIIGFSMDITESRQLEMESRQLAAIVQSSDDAIFAKSLDGVIQTWNLGAEKLYGYSAQEIIGKNVNVLAPENCKHEIEHILKRIAQGESINQFETIRKKKDGEKINVSLTLSPIRDSQGVITAISVIARDVTTFKKSEERVLLTKILLQKEVQNAQKFHQAVEASSIATVITTTEPRILYANPAWEQLTGYMEKEALGENPRILQSGKTPKTLYPQLWTTILSNTEYRTEDIINRRKNGTEYNADLRIFPIVEDGKVQFLVGLQTDITLRKRTEVAKSEFMSLASHQLRTPLTGIRWGLSILRKKGPLNPLQNEVADELQLASTRMAESINVMLHLSRIEAGKMEVTKAPLPLKTFVQSLCEEFHPQAEQMQHACSLLCEENITLMTDEKLLREIMANLLTNAIKYTPKGGTVELNAKRFGNVVRLSVHDSGYGIPQDQQEKIFSKFFRATNVTGKIPDGTGLGLYLVYALTQLLGGTISFVSQENVGTTFTLSLPIPPQS